MALVFGKRKENRPEDMKFSDWAKAAFPGLDTKDEVPAAIWYATEFPSESEKDIPPHLSYPKSIKAWFNEQQATQSLPEDLQTITPVLTLNSPSGTPRRSTSWPTVRLRESA